LKLTRDTQAHSRCAPYAHHTQVTRHKSQRLRQHRGIIGHASCNDWAPSHDSQGAFAAQNFFVFQASLVLTAAD